MQFIGQIVGVFLLRRSAPNRPRPFRIWLAPLPGGLALAGWLYVYATSGWLFAGLGVLTLGVGVVAFLAWSLQTGGWPFTKTSS